MHELSIVMGILDIAENTVRSNNATTVERIDLQIGRLAGVDWPALDFAWKSATPGTILGSAECHIDKPPGRAKCLECNTEFEVENYFDPCPTCGQFLTEIVSGKELRVISLSIN